MDEESRMVSGRVDDGEYVDCGDVDVRVVCDFPAKSYFVVIYRLETTPLSPSSESFL